ncbi:MAG: MlaD family protein [Candidatus Bruticola sp.]
MSKESKIGAVLVLLVILLFIFAPSSETRDSSIFSNNYTLIFNETPGLELNYDVKMAGVDIGYVKEIDFCTDEERKLFGDDAHIAVTIATDFTVKIPEDSSANILEVSSSLLWLEISPGLSEKCLENGSRVRLRSSPVSSYSGSMSGSPFSELNEKTLDLRRMMTSGDFSRKILDLASNMRFFSNELRLVSKGAHHQMESIHTKLDAEEQAIAMQLDRLDKQLSQAGASLQKASSSFKEQSRLLNSRVGQYDQQLRRLSEVALQETERFKILSQQAETKMTDKCSPELTERLHKASRKLDSYAQIAEDLRYIIQEPSTQQALKDTAHNYRLQSAQIEKLLRKIDNFVPGSDDTSDSSKGSYFEKAPAASEGGSTLSAGESTPSVGEPQEVRPSPVISDQTSL